MRTLARGWHAKSVVVFADGSAESPLESLSRLRLSQHGLPTPCTQVDLLAERGRFLGRADFYWDEHGVVGEADGLGKYAQPGALGREKLRQEAMEQVGLRIVRWGWTDLGDFAIVRRRLEVAFASSRTERRWRARA